MRIKRVEMQLHQTQADFAACQKPYRGFVGGRGAGKTFIGAYDMIRRSTSPSGRNRLYMVIAPTYNVLSDVTIRSFKQLAIKLHCYDPSKARLNPPSMTMPGGSEILFRSADTPERLRGPNLSGVWMDEASIMHHDAYLIAIGGLREQSGAGWLSATFTPKGQGHWTYETFGKPRPGNALYHSSTYNNPFLSADFVRNLEGEYVGKFAEQELSGMFVDPDGSEWPAEYFSDDIWFDEWPSTIAIKTLGVDPSKGSDGKSGDYSAIVKLGRDANGILYCEANLERRNTEEIVSVVLETQGKFRADGVAVESNQFQQLLAVQIQERARVAGMPCPVVQLVNTVSKQVRIRRLGPYLAQKTIRFKSNSIGTKLLVSQLRDFPTGKHDDGPDSLEMALRVMIDLYNGRHSRIVKRVGV